MKLRKPRHRPWLWFVLLNPGLLFAAPADTAPLVSVLAYSKVGCPNQPLINGLRELGYVEGRNIKIRCRHAGGVYSRLSGLAREIIQEQPNVMVALGHAPSLAARQATSRIPIVMLVSGEPAIAGLVESIRRPGGNATGLSYFNTELNFKRMQYLKALVPRLRRLAVVIDPMAPSDLNGSYLRDSSSAGERLGFETSVFDASNLTEMRAVFGKISDKKFDAIFVPPKSLWPGELDTIASQARHYRIPVMHYARAYTSAGGLISYGADYPNLNKRAANYVVKILRGANPATIPMEQPRGFVLSVNARVARELGLRVPDTLLALADTVIE